LKWSKRAGLRAGYGAVIAGLLAEVLDKERGFSIDVNDGPLAARASARQAAASVQPASGVP
jgi:hypothetical protein